MSFLAALIPAFGTAAAAGGGLAAGSTFAATSAPLLAGAGAAGGGLFPSVLATGAAGAGLGGTLALPAAGAGSLATLGLALQGVGVGGQVVGGLVEAQQGSDLAAEIARLQAEQLAETTAREAEERARTLRRLRARQQALFGVSGVVPGTGSPLLIELETLRETRRQITDLFTNAFRQRQAFSLEATSRRNRAISSGLSLIGSGIGSAGSLATSVARSRLGIP